MQWAFFRIPVTGGDEAIELNRFLRSVRVLNIHREFVGQGDGSYWAMSVEYLPAAESAPRAAAATSAHLPLKWISRRSTGGFITTMTM